MKAPPLLLALAIVGGLVVAVAASLRAPVLAPSAPAILAPSLALFLPLEEGVRTDYDLVSDDGEITVHQEVTGWFVLNGAPHARLETRFRTNQLVQIEWLTAGVGPDGEPQVLCSRRELAGRSFDLVPPQPVLQGTLAAGTTWSWTGMVGWARGRAEFTVVRREVQDGQEVVVVEQKTELDGSPPLSNTRVQTFAAGRGLIEERGTHPAHQKTRRDDTEMRATEQR